MLRSIVSCVILFHISARLASAQFTDGTSTFGYGSYTSVNVGLTGTSPTRVSPPAGTSTARLGSPGTTARPGSPGTTARPGTSTMRGPPTGGTSPTGIASTGGFTSAGTSVPITTFYPVLTIYNTYGYLVQSLDPLQELTFRNDSILKSVQEQVVAKTFNFASIRATVTEVQIQRRLRARAAIDYNMLVLILFQLGNASCTITCLDSARINASTVVAVQLPLLNGSLANVDVTLQPLTLSELPRANVKLGEASPGLAAKLGMGLGIAALVVLVIGEVAFLYLRTRSTPGTDYSIPMHNRV